jgi:hypothetical protein
MENIKHCCSTVHNNGQHEGNMNKKGLNNVDAIKGDFLK